MKRTCQRKPCSLQSISNHSVSLIEIKMSNNSSAVESWQFNATKVSASKIDAKAIAQLVPIASLIVVANGLVLVLFAKRRRLRTPANYVLFSLAICDFMNGVLNIPLLIIVAFTPAVKSSELSLSLGFLVSVLHNLTAICTCYHILFATTEKYLSIIRPLRHRSIRRKTVVTVLGIVWALSVVVAFFPLIAWVNMKDKDINAKLRLGHAIFCLFAVFLLPYSFIIYAFVVIFRWISSQGKTNSKALCKVELSRQSALEKRCLTLFVTMAMIYLICWLPWYILVLLHRVYNNSNHLKIPSQVFLLLRYATSITNPALYTFFRRDFKMALKSLFGDCPWQNSRSCRFSKAKRQSAQGVHLTPYQMAEGAV